MSSLSKKKELNEALIAPGRRGIWEKPLLLLLNAFNYLWFLAWFNCADFYTKPASTSPWGSGTGLILLFASCLLLWLVLYLNHRFFLLWTRNLMVYGLEDEDSEEEGESDQESLLQQAAALKRLIERRALIEGVFKQLFAASTFVGILLLNLRLQHLHGRIEASDDSYVVLWNAALRKH